jgi:hypothetical protein
MTPYIQYPFVSNTKIDNRVLLGFRGVTSVRIPVTLDSIATSGMQRVFGFKLDSSDLFVDVPILAEWPYSIRLYGTDYDLVACFGESAASTPDATGLGLEIEPALVIARPVVLRSINGLTGAVKLVPGSNARLVKKGKRIILTAAPGHQQQQTQTTTGIHYIGTVRPNSYGDLRLTAGPGVVITPEPDAHIVRFTQTRSEPGCNV